MTVQKSDNEPNSSVLLFRSHTALLLATSLPFLQPALRHPVELITKVLELSATMKLYQEFHSHSSSLLSGLLGEGTHNKTESGFFGLINKFISDPEGLLSGLSCVCTGSEKETINLLLNLLHAKNFYENYGDLLKTFMSSDDSLCKPETPPADTTPADNFSMPNLASVMADGDLTSMLSKEQTDTLNLLKSLLEQE